MNGRATAFWGAAGEAVLLLLAFLPPLALFLNGYDTALVKDLTVQAGAALAAAAFFARAVESGRFEVPRGRGLPAALGLLWLAWSALTVGSGAPILEAARGLAFPIVFLAALLGPASYGFSARLSDWTVAAAALAGFSSGRVSPDLVGVFLAIAFPLALARALEPGRSLAGQAAFWVAAALCACGVLDCGSPAGLIAFSAGAAAFAVFALLWGRSPSVRFTGLLAAAVVPLLAAAAFSVEGFERLWLLLERPSALGLLPLLAGALALAFLLRDLSARWRSGEAREGVLMMGQWAGLAAALSAGLFSPVLDSAAPGLLVWLMAGSLLGLALRKGAGQLSVLPVPAPLYLRRALYLPLAALFFWAVSVPGLLFRSDVAYNEALAQSGLDPLGALERLDAVWERSPLHVKALVAQGSLRLRQEDALEAALALYSEAAALSPRDAGLQRAIGVLQSRRADWEGARRTFTVAAGLAPQDPGLWKLLLESCVKLGRKPEALAAARGLLRADPRDPQSWRQLAEQYRENRQYSLAKALERRFLRGETLARSRKLNLGSDPKVKFSPRQNRGG